MIQLSVIIPFYNSASYFKETLESVKCNLNEKIEIIIIDDGSNDNSIEIINQVFAQGSYNMKILSRPLSKPKGANACRNYGLENSVGHYVMFIDSDDLISLNCISNRMNYINNYSIQNDMYIFQTAFMNDEKNITGVFAQKIEMTYDQILLSFLDHKIPWHTMSVIWDRNFLISIEQWNEKYPRLQDVELNIRALLKKPRIHIVQNGSIDSYYRSVKMNNIKERSARYGFVMIIHDYYTILMNKFCNIAETKHLITQIFQKQLISTLGSYLQSENIDNEWCELYLKTLSVCEMDTDEIESIKNFLKKNGPD
ncbi:glycosyltransferase family 2 protein [Elizabethkingia anophelis]|uniref:Glycosyltransferase n=1 Tax=Elizabethkingia anophelis NUHP1 TaxID=1338011 RepID=A0A077ED97_9FLAO|nr:glycosyltransferase family 2 protein [Elizabethkingia anophelis]AIL45516.1 Glycosyltransferase [Elizabethkingia anophelis NUHP1]MBE9395465.1 glycosyltransferase family 2 protein [Elizabethkingia anophelis]MBE9408275.1 glycosyltransferase family 2 protein [Elizabethkingia anophelis]MDV3927968.1 glycosyltransferase family 2 protein [Elizabethkingia anophelis]MDV4024290.1 glycosyltransferase family 2 protein [Elizabethkingia anophelis]